MLRSARDNEGLFDEEALVISIRLLAGFAQRSLEFKHLQLHLLHFLQERHMAPIDELLQNG